MEVVSVSRFVVQLFGLCQLYDRISANDYSHFAFAAGELFLCYVILQGKAANGRRARLTSG